MTGTTSIGRTGKTMKCKAKWVADMQDWVLHCEEHDTYTTFVQGTYPKRLYPHDMAVTHVQRHHKE